MHGTELLVISGILVVGFACQWIAWRLRLPSILFLLLVGISAGPVLGWLDPDALLGDLLEPIVSLAVAVILYEGSMTLKVPEIRGHGAVVRNLVTAGVLITWAAAAFSAHYLIGFDLYLAALFGAIVTVSGPTVMLPLLRSIRPTKDLAGILRWEAILVDPIGAILAVLVFNFIVVTQTAADFSSVVESFGLIVIVGCGFGVAAGQVFGFVLKRHWLPDYLRNYGTLAVVLLVFSLAELIESESGLLAVTIMGVWQANMRGLDLDDILDFKESLTLVLVAGLFIILAARIDLAGLLNLGLGALAVLAFLQFVAGPVRALVCSIGSDLGWPKRLFLGWLYPRGIVAAAVSALFALRLENMGYPGADVLVPMVFTVILGTVVVQSLTGSAVAKLLRVANPEPKGVLITGANPVALEMASALRDAGHQVLVASTSWKGISEARMNGIPVFYGSPVSAYAERNMDLIGLGNLLALSSLPGLNELACVKYRFEFGRDAVYTMPRRKEKDHEKHQISGDTSGQILCGGKYSLDDLMDRLRSGAKVRTTEITENYNFDNYLEENPDAIILFAANNDGKLKFPVGEGRMNISPGYRISALVPAD